MEILRLLQNAEDFEIFSAGQTIFLRGEPGTVMYIIKQGEVELYFRKIRFATLGPEGIFGEMALLDNELRSLTAIAKTECQLVPIDQARFSFFVQQKPLFALQIMQVMADRLRSMNEVVGDSQNLT
ncbi:MAG: cyclic nucleotide-binding domain-containing protein [Nitrospirota bacterium]|nr:MAG: cyclic nucleotide-binding domain-containing protein [Nitrospirota bacterium]